MLSEAKKTPATIHRTGEVISKYATRLPCRTNKLSTETNTMTMANQPRMALSMRSTS